MTVSPWARPPSSVKANTARLPGACFSSSWRARTARSGPRPRAAASRAPIARSSLACASAGSLESVTVTIGPPEPRASLEPLDQRERRHADDHAGDHQRPPRSVDLGDPALELLDVERQHLLDVDALDGELRPVPAAADDLH